MGPVIGDPREDEVVMMRKNREPSQRVVKQERIKGRLGRRQSRRWAVL